MKHRVRPYTLITLLLTAIGIGAFFVFASALFDYAKGDSKLAMQTFVRNEIRSMATELKAATEQIQIIAASLTDTTDFASPVVLRRVQEYHNQTHFKHLLSAGLNGLAVDNTGRQYQVAGRPAVQRALLGETGIYEGTDISGQKTIVLSSPVIKDGRVKGVVLGEYDLFALYQIINMENRHGESYAALINSSGDFLVRADSDNRLVKKGDNLFAAMEGLQFKKGSSLNQMLSDMHVKKSGFCEYGDGTNERVLYYGPVGINDWYLVKVHTDAMIQEDIAPIKQMVQKLSLVLAAVLVLLSVLVYHGLYTLRRAQHEEALRFKTVADNIPGGVAELVLGQELKVKYANEAFYQLLDCPEAEFHDGKIAGYLSRILPEHTFAHLRTTIEQAVQAKRIFNFDFVLPAASAKPRWLNLNGRIISRGKKGLTLQAVLVDVTEEKERLAAIEAQSRLDEMTGIYNKTSAQHLVKDRTEEADSAAWSALVVMDIDRFKGVNDHFGHLVGDEVIAKIGAVLKNYFKLPDIAGRAGGDEFIVYVDHVSGYNQISLILHQLQGAIKALRFSDPKLHITCSMGCVCGPRFAFREYNTAFELADKNLYVAKSRNRGDLEITFLEDASWGPLS
jgi:diguanylate cyclase (GGDEF)-like protein